MKLLKKSVLRANSLCLMLKAMHSKNAAHAESLLITLLAAFQNWQLPQSLDRVYDSSSACDKLGWSPIHGFKSVLEMLDTEIPEVLPILKRS